MCGGPTSLQCARCRGVWYCGPKCQRGAWGAHKSACAPAGARGGGEAGAGGGGGGGGVAEFAAPRNSDSAGVAREVGLRLSEIASAVVAMLESRTRKERASVRWCGSPMMLALTTTRKLVEFQEAVVAADSIPALVRALGAAEAAKRIQIRPTLCLCSLCATQIAAVLRF